MALSEEPPANPLLLEDDDEYVAARSRLHLTRWLPACCIIWM